MPAKKAKASAPPKPGPVAVDPFKDLPPPADPPEPATGLALVVRRSILLAILTLQLCLGASFLLRAYTIRLHAVKEYGKVIHEFDPWFNFRATQYLADNGWHAFFHWFDHMSWYPLGRPVGTTIYPGMQITAVAIWKGLQELPPGKIPRNVTVPAVGTVSVPAPLRFKWPMSLNDVCVFIPAWFGSLASLLLGLLTYECSGSVSAGVVATGVMGVIPAHIMRSVAGGYDNESVAMSAICLTFWLWCRSIRTPSSWPFGFLAGLAYIYMAAAWGGYIFVINMVGLHAAMLVAIGRYNSSLYKAYTAFFVVGTVGATFVPPIGWAPLRSLEQVGPLICFSVYQLIYLCDVLRARSKKPMTGQQFFILRLKVFGAVCAALFVVAWILLQVGYFQPLGARIRGLFLRHHKTGNPLVDSVAEHSRASDNAYWQYLHYARDVGQLGFLMCFFRRTNGMTFLGLYAVVAYQISLKMSRLMIICGPIASALSGVAVGLTADWCIEQLLALAGLRPSAPAAEPDAPERTGGMGSIYRYCRDVCMQQTAHVRAKIVGEWRARAPSHQGRAALGSVVACAIIAATMLLSPKPLREFSEHCNYFAMQMSHPQLMFMHQGPGGQKMIIDDYIRAYWWLRDHTPQDARVMAWWDYGYQITGIANRTSIADGNTWNHEHIATLGKCLTSPEDKAHRMVRHLADYVLVWAGNQGDDLGKSPHMARIGTSIYSDICPGDPTCSMFGFDHSGQPTPMMAKSLLYKLHSHDIKPGVRVNPKLFKHVHTTRYGLVRIFEVMNVSLKSKQWVADPENRKCDAPGSWYCVGQYPPAMQKFFTNKRDFAQLEDFNKKTREKNAYTRLVEERQRRGGGGEL